LAGILFLGEKRVLYTAHLADTCQEIFGMMKMICSHPALEETVAHVYDSNGKERIEFRNGGRFQVRTRTGHGGRGRETDLLIFDEAMILDSSSESSLLPLTAAAASAGRGQVIYASSAGSDSEESEILKRLSDRGRELAGTPGEGLSYREFTADRRADISDPQTWRDANPSLGTVVLSEKFLRDQLLRMKPEEFGREHLGWWSASTDLPLIDPADWEALIVEEEPTPATPAMWVSFDLAPDRRTARLLGFFRTDAGKVAVSVLDSINDDRGIDGDSYAQHVLSIVTRYEPEVIGYDRLTGEHVAQLLANCGWKNRLRPMSGAKAANGVGTLKALVTTGMLEHDGHPDLADDLSRAIGKAFADGGQVFSRKAATDGSIAGAIALGNGIFLAADELLA
jgi:phage terminase large subunit-like protein